MDTFGEIESELSSIEAQTFMFPIEMDVYAKTTEMDIYLRYVTDNAGFSRRQLADQEEIERLDPECNGLSISASNKLSAARLMSLVKRRIYKKMNLVNAAINKLDELKHQTFDMYICQVSDYLAMLTFDPKKANVQSEIDQFKSYLIDRQYQYQNVHREFTYTHNALLEYYQALK